MNNPNFQNIPEELKSLPQWVWWRLEERGGRQTKIPYSAAKNAGARASTTDPITWGTFDRACLLSKNGNGIGFVFTQDSGFVGLDMDHKIDMELVNWFGSYAEKSQSGTGAHIIMKGVLPKRFDDETEGKGRRDKDGVFELYSQGRYFCMTGDLLLNEPVKEAQDKLNQFVLEVFPAPEKFDEGTVNLSKICGASIAAGDPTILERIRNSDQADKFNSLWSGAWQSLYASQSDADAALLSILRFWTGGNQRESFDLFKQSGLMRKKSERADYLARTWKAIDNGEVYEAVEPVPAEFIQARNENTPPWRKITINHVREAIAGTILEPMTWALCAPTDPPLPLEVGLSKALTLCGCALSGKRPTQRKLGDLISKGGDLSRVRIMTGGGMTPNFWTMLMGESASGKDIGGIMDKAAMQFKWLVGTAGSEEGIADSYIAQPVGLLSISEMMNWLDIHHWQSKAAGFLTHAYNKGWFSHAMSKRGDGPARETDYCFPNIAASIQPGVLQEYTRKSHIDSGFLGRFIVMQMPKFVAYPVCGDLKAEVEVVVDCLKILNAKEGWITPPPRYNQALNDMFSRYDAQPTASWKRLSSEYYPRLALLLSITDDDISPDVVITEEGWTRAAVLVQYLFGQAEAVLGELYFDPTQNKFEALCTRILGVIKAKPNGCAKSLVAANTGRGTKAKDRDEAVKELIARGNIMEEKITTKGKVATVYKAT